ncbi:MOSC domain-containing protein [Paraburkholderia sp.]|uniref:MOSC domain-containing protein n=1 Tax=Paraburkholderia sp. TaxID=1926495 RepID=UPI0023A1E71B|nr:MOSC domain-containing protein [Paraburkholderia sp.]MDE1182167.1 MOSC domain-containing protein [Paraburkholderia sp.]
MNTETLPPSSTQSADTAWRGRVEHLHLCPRAFLPMRGFTEIELLAGKGIVGDRYMNASGFYSHKPEEGRQVTLFEVEALDAIYAESGIRFGPEEHRRNVTVRGVPLNSLVGKRFWLGSTLLEATRLSVPCRHIEEVTGKPVFDAMLGRSGLNCRILTGGIVRIGDPLFPADASHDDANRDAA